MKKRWCAVFFKTKRRARRIRGGEYPSPIAESLASKRKEVPHEGDCVPLAAWKPIGRGKAFPATGDATEGDAVSLATGDDGGPWFPPAPGDISSGEEETSPQR